MREADVHLPETAVEAMGLEVAPEGLEGVDRRDVTLLSCDGAASVIVATYSAPVDEALDAIDHVDWYERLGTDRDGVTYLERVVAPALPEDTPSPQQEGLAIEEVSPGERGCTITVVGEQGDIRGHVEGGGEVDLPVTLERLTDYAGPRAPLDELTDRQREVIETAHELGYYEVPRQATADAIATELDLDRSTVTEHLQRAERNLIGPLLRD